jgi:hypothetical protein
MINYTRVFKIQKKDHTVQNGKKLIALGLYLKHM